MISLLLALLGFVGGIILLDLLSEKAIEHSLKLAYSLGIPPLFIGLTLISLVTDLPETVNSLIASGLGHGDINLGNSIGSVLAQLTLTLGILPFVWRKKLISLKRAKVTIFLSERVVVRIKKKNLLILGISLILALLLLLSVSTKGSITRLDAMSLIIAYFVLMSLIWLVLPKPRRRRKKETIASLKLHLSITILTLLGVSGSSYLVVKSLIILSEILEVKEFLLSFFLLAIGTSLPEIAITLVAAKRKAAGMAIGNSLGSCIVDATFAPAIGPLVFPVKISAKLSVFSILYTLLVTFLIITLIYWNRGKIDQKLGLIFILLYLFSFLLLR